MTRAAAREQELTVEDLAGMLETVLGNQDVILEQQAEIIEKLTNLGLERDDYPGYGRE